MDLDGGKDRDIIAVIINWRVWLEKERSRIFSNSRNSSL